MGLFSIIGKIAKAGLGVVTRGASDKIIAGIKSVIGAKPKAAAAAAPKALPPTAQQRLIEAAIETTPRVRRTEAHFGGRSEGWGFGNGRKAAAKRRPRRRSYAEVMQAEGISQGYIKPTKKRSRRAGSPAKPRSPRQPPSGGLDLKAIGAAWSAAGKGPGTGMTWAQFRAANSHLRLK